MTDAGAAPGFAKAPPPAVEDWLRGWPVVAAGFCGYMLISLGMLSGGVFMEPVRHAFGWNRGQFSSGLTVYAVVGVVLAPLVGLLIDRRGPRLVAVVGCLLAGMTFALFATASHSIYWWLTLWVLFASACQLIMPTLWSAAIARVFTVSLGLAMSVAIAGSGVAAFLFPKVAYALITHYDFRTAYLVMGFGFGIPVALISALAMPGPATRRDPAKAQSQPEAPAQPGLTLAQGLRSLVFYKLAVAILVTNFFSMALAFHLFPLLGDAGLSGDRAVFGVEIYGVAALIGKVLGGAALDRFSGRQVASVFVLFLIAGVAMLTPAAMTLAWAIVAAVLFGIAYGALGPVWPYLASRYFGLRAYGRLFGIMSSCYTLALATGPLVAGDIFGLRHSYLLFLLAGLPALAVILLASLTLGPYPTFADPGSEPAKG